MTEREKITWQELRDLFGEMMPVEVASITANAGSVEEARRQLRELASLTPPAAEGAKVNCSKCGWRSIASAPTDGTWFLACSTALGWRTVRVVCYRYPDDRLPTHGEGNVWPSAPTHWMPLPAYPNTPPIKEPLTTEAADGALRRALADLLPTKLCGEAWDLPDSETVSIAVTFGKLRAARTALADCGDALSPAAVGGER